MVRLRQYQFDYINELKKSFIKGYKRVILCATTGAGKTIMFSFMTLESFKKEKKTLILTDRKELFTQSDGTLQKFGLEPNLIKPNSKNLDGNLHVGMVQTITRRLHKKEYQDFISTLDFIIIDEAHKTIFDEMFKYISPRTFVIGATATPHREGKQESLDKYYNDLVQVLDTEDLINLGNLSKCISYGVKVDLKGVKTKSGDYDEKSMSDRYSEIKLYHGVLENWKRICPNTKTLIFASSLESSQELVNDWQSKGINAKHVDCYMKNRDEVLEWFKNTEGAVLSNYGILTTGFDEPTIETIILYRATKSLPLFLQMVGRGSRTTETKNRFTLLDFGNNIKTHGFWEQSRQWNLKKKEKKLGEAPIKECPECAYILYASIMECPECGHIFEKSEKQKEEDLIVELKKLTVEEMNFHQLVLYAKERNYKDGWILHQLKNITQLEEYARFKGYKRGWVERIKNSAGNYRFLSQ